MFLRCQKDNLIKEKFNKGENIQTVFWSVIYYAKTTLLTTMPGGRCSMVNLYS